jgi:hypothetical protein
VRRFWASLVLGGLLASIGSAFVLSAHERSASDGLLQYWTGEGGTILLGCSSIFSTCEEFDPTLWYAVGTGLLLAAAVSLAVAARVRTPA